MKKINLIEWLSRNSHEKQSPQRFARYEAMLIMLLTLGVGQMWASTTATMYFSIPASTVGCYTVKAYYNFGYSQSGTVNMTKVGYNGTDVVYSVELTADHDNVDDLKFQWWDGETWKGEKQVLSGWVALDKDGRMYSYSSSSWGSYSIDAATSYKIYFVNNDSWGSCYAYAYYADCQNNWSWHGQSMSSESKQYGTKNIYSITLTSRFPNVIFNDNSSSEKASTACYDNRGKMYDNGTWRTLQYKVTLNMQSGTGGSGSVTAVCGSAMPSATMPTRDGYTFAGYYTSTGGSGTKYYNADGTSANDWPANGTGPTTLYAHWTQDPGVATLTAAGNATELWIGVNASAALTFTATSSNVSSGTAVTWSLTDNTGDCTVSTTTSSYSGATFSYTPGSTGAKTITVTMTIGGNNYTKTYNLTVYERWNIYVRDDVDNWGTMKLYLYDNSTSAHKTDWPGDACSSYKSSAKWYTVTLDSKYPHFILNNSSTKQLLGGGSIATNKAIYTPGSYWKTVWNSNGTGGDAGKTFYTLTSATISDPVVTITRCDVYSTYALLEGNVTGFGGDGSALSDLKEYGFYIGETKNTSIQSTSGTRFRVKVKGLTPGNTYNIKAFATNIDNTANSAVQSKTASNASRTIGVRYPDATAQTLKLYAYRDIPADYGTETVKNDVWSGVTLTRRAGTSRWWETTLTNAADYEYFIVSNNGNKQAGAQAMPGTDKCYWYNPDGDAPKIGIMDCPYTTPQLYINATAGATDYAYNEMGTSPSISKTMSLSAGTYTFKIMYNAEWYGKNSDNTISRTGATTSNAVSGMTIDQGYITLTADFAGDYIFTFNPSTNTVSVTYPTAYAVTYSKSIVGTDNSTTAAPSAAYTTGATAVTSGDLVPNGTNVTFTAAAAGTGYTWKGWYTVADPSADYSANRVATTAEYATTISAATTIYAVYAEDMHTVTVTAGTHGNITTPVGGSGSTVTAGIATSATIAAAAAEYGYVFKNWTITSGESTDVNFAGATTASTTITATADATVQANFISHWTVVGGDSETNDGDDAMGNWNEYANAIDHFTQNAEKQYVGYAEISLPANTTFYVKIRDLHNTNWYGNTGEMTYTNNEGLTMESGISTNCRITTAGAGTYTFTWNENTKKLTVTYPDSYTVTYGKVANNGQNIGGVTVTGDDGATLESGKYVAKGSATFTAAAAANYTFIDWRTSATYGEGTQLSTDNPYTMTSIAENKTVYAHYAENMTTVTLASTAGGHIEIGGATVTSTTAGAVTTRNLTPVANTGYYFAGWTKTACTDYSISGAENSEDNTTITLTGLGTGATSGETLTANFVELEKVYFRNWNEDSSEPLWENVYAYFSISYENDGEGKSCAKSNSSSDYSGILMTQEGSTNVYWAYVPRGTTRNGDDDIAFSNHNFGTNYKFNGYEAVKRGDYKTGWNMFVPQSSNNETLNETKYYNGYWKHHNVAVGTDAGYRIERYNGSGYVDPADNGDGSEHHRDFTVTSENTIQYQLRVHNLTSGYNNYMIYNVGGTHYITFGESVQETGYTITNTDCSNIGLSEYIGGSPRFYITPTSEGIYTLTIDMSGDVMRLSVNYPVAVGDYMLVHSYNNGSAKTHYSDIIKSTEVGERRYSMYIDSVSSDSPSLTLKKCTGISAEGNPEWNTGTAVGMSGFTANTKGVYVFDVAIANNVATLSHIEAYTGNYYIKTDCATGGWTAYTQNVMEKNNATFSATDASTYDYLYCKWVDSGNGGDGGGTNVKCVIANDYCIAVSDTLEGDDILGGAQILPRAANVRFSYNSTTNTLKRTYINGATGWESSFLSLTDAKSNFEGTGDDMITHFDGTALNNDTLSFVDKNNWIYQRDLKAKPGTRIRLTANYKYSDKDHQQYLIGDAGDLSSSTTVQIIGGTTDEFIPMRAIYDFKTNNLIVGYLASDEEVTKTRALYADVLIVREDQEDAAQITFGDNVQFTEVDTVYGIIEFNKSTILDETKSIYERSLYWISFPFDVNLNEAFGFGEYGTHWMIQYYDGASRAQNGFWAEVETYWKWITPAERKAGFVLEANKGYLLGLDLDEMTSSSTVWGNNVTSVSLYFPSKGSVGTIESPLASSKSVSVTAHECTIERDDRWYKDANWNVIGVPSYANITKTVVDGTIVTKTETLVTQDVPFLYTHDMTDNTLEAVASSEVTFKSMQAYVVQYAGTIDWTVATTPFAAPKRTPEQNGERNLTLNLLDDNDAQDHTFIRFTYEEGITEGLDMNKDLTKEFKPTTNIYSLVQGRASQVQLAANLLPADYTSTTVEIGVRVAQTGYYTFSMPSTDGLSVVLYDRMTGTRTNLLIGTYRTELSAGTTNGRFVLEIGNAQAPTFIQSVDTDANGERVIKFVQDGQLYILKNGRVFNAEGKAIE